MATSFSRIGGFWRGSAGAVAALLLALIAPAGQAAEIVLKSTSTSHYDLYSNVEPKKAGEIARHMDAVYSEYAHRFRAFSASERNAARMPLYLFRTQQQYLAFMQQKGVDATGTGGIFFIRPDARGLATWVEERPQWVTLETLQHEGFHQFAYAHIGVNIPTWVNEGLAEYFGDAILVDGKLRIGMASSRRIETLKEAVKNRRIIDFDLLMAMQPGQWHMNLVRNPDRGRLQYDQSWAMVYFLIHGQDGRYRDPFEKYLVAIGKGMDQAKAFKHAFGAEDAAAFRRQWDQFVMQLQPDAVDVAVGRMRFLAEGVLLLKQRGEPVPDKADALRVRLTQLGFRAVRIENGVRTEISATDPALWVFSRANGSTGSFELLEPSASALPPRITAEGLKPQPTLKWEHDADGKVVPALDYR